MATTGKRRGRLETHAVISSTHISTYTNCTNLGATVSRSSNYVVDLPYLCIRIITKTAYAILNPRGLKYDRPNYTNTIYLAEYHSH